MTTKLLAEGFEATTSQEGEAPPRARPGEVERALDALSAEIERRETEARARAAARIRFDLD